MALIIMIVIILILLGVGTKVIVDGKLISTAEKTVNGTNNKIAEEQEEVDYYVGKLIDIDQSQCNHIWEELIVRETTCAEQGQRKKVCNKCDKEEIEQIQRLPHKFENGKCTVCEQDLILGSYITGYNPSIGANGEKIETSYTSEGSQTGGTLEEDGTLDGTKGNGHGDQTFTVKSIEKWRIVKQDEEGRILITTADIIQTDEEEPYYIAGQAGYMNGVEELNKICSIYGQGKYADKTLYAVGNGTTKTSGGRSIIPEDCWATSYSSTTCSKDANGVLYINKDQSEASKFYYLDETNNIWKELQNGEEVELATVSWKNTRDFSKLEHDMLSNDSSGTAVRYYFAKKALSRQGGTYWYCHMIQSGER